MYIKTKEGQIIADSETFNEIDKLGNGTGVINILNLYFIKFKNQIRFAVEYQYQSISKTFLFELLKKIVKDIFKVNLDVTYLSLVQDYDPADFKKIFNASKKNKQVILIDEVDDLTEIINSKKIEFSIKASTIFDTIKEFINEKISSDNIKRFIVKCENSADNKLATYEADTNRWDKDWIKPARLNIKDAQSEIILNFLKKESEICLE